VTVLETDRLLLRPAPRQAGHDLWLVAERERPERAIGLCGLMAPSFLPPVLPAAEVGWRLERAAWGRGIATEAARATIAHGFEAHGLGEILAVVAPDNPRSLRVCEKLGMTPRPDRVHPATGDRVRVLGVRPESYTGP
jgi:RimJ/RimL family protein N-acetyltransferase